MNGLPAESNIQLFTVYIYGHELVVIAGVGSLFKLFVNIYFKLTNLIVQLVAGCFDCSGGASESFYEMGVIYITVNIMYFFIIYGRPME